MTQNNALEIVTGYQDAWTRRDLETASSYLAEDVVFRSGRQALNTRNDLISMLGDFTQRVEQRWERVAETVGDDSVLILYNLFTLNGEPGMCADYFTLNNGKIQSETLVFDPRPFLAASQQEPKSSGS